MTAPLLSLPSPQNNYHNDYVLLMLKCLKNLTGVDLLQVHHFSEEMAGQQIFYADFCLLSHNGAADPILNYGNQKALDLWEVSWEELTQMPSRTTAKPDAQPARERMLQEARTQGYITDYHGVRISRSGREFRIWNATIWSLVTETGEPCGQAAWFEDFAFL